MKRKKRSQVFLMVNLKVTLIRYFEVADEKQKKSCLAVLAVFKW